MMDPVDKGVLFVHKDLISPARLALFYQMGVICHICRTQKSSVSI